MVALTDPKELLSTFSSNMMEYRKKRIDILNMMKCEVPKRFVVF